MGFTEIGLIAVGMAAVGHFAQKMIRKHLLWKHGEQEESDGSQPTDIEDSPLPALRNNRRNTH
jgi:hypothetical protein